MKLLLVVGVMMAAACATVNPHAYSESEFCPNFMSEEQHRSGVVRCTAQCSSYGRDFAVYADDCKCYCTPAGGVKQQAAPSKPPMYNNQM